MKGLLDYSFRFEPPTKTHKARYQITGVTRNDTMIEQHQQCFGWRVYVSNTPVERLSFEQAVLTYRDSGLSNMFIGSRGNPSVLVRCLSSVMTQCRG
ncbi:MAG: hypothetical protein QNJ46_06960 [Leptolyngbyaceae cyanobacterium MO_188.B28]|nr:hypothetical protein [Leptolyngbyaceae cyanobacterium MO_188.B28]